MKNFFGLMLVLSLCFSYDIKHENLGKIYKINGDSDGEKFELYLNYFDVEFQNFKEENELIVPPKISGHLFFKGEKFDFDKGELEQNSTNITSLYVNSSWLNFDVKADKNGKLIGKLAIKGKAMKASAKIELEYENLVLALQILKANNIKYQAVISNFFASKFHSKFKNSLENELENLRLVWLKTPVKNTTNNKIMQLIYQNDIFKSICQISNKTHKNCSVILLKNNKPLTLNKIFQSSDNKNMEAVFNKFKVIPSENFALTPAGICFFDNDKICIGLNEIKPFFKFDFGLWVYRVFLTLVTIHKVKNNNTG